LSIQDRSLLLRDARDEDLPELHHLVYAALLHDDDAAEVLDLLWGNAEDVPALRVVATVGDEIVGVALGSLGKAFGHFSGNVSLLAVSPAQQGRGYGRALLRELEQRLRDAGAEQLVIRGSVPAYAWPGIDVRYTAAVCLAVASGYEQAQQAINMTVDLTTAPLDTAADVKRLAADGITVRRLRADDQPAFGAWMREWGGTWEAEASATLAHDPVGCHIAVREDAGSGVLEYLGFACQGVNRPTWFGPMGTAEAARGKGIGVVLLRRCLADLRDAGATEAEIGWTGPIHFYARTVGATIGRVFWMYKKAC
jgi:mycothiol synthase